MDLKTIVVPLDASERSERALPIAATLAEHVDAGLLLVSAQFHGPLHPADYLEEMATRVTGCPVDTIGAEYGSAATAITDALGDANDRIVCMTTHGRGSVGQAVLGSVAEEVLRRCERPILLVGDECRVDFLEHGTELLACADGPAAAAALAGPTTDWANALGLRRRVAFVVHPLDVESAERSDLVLEPIAHALGLSSVKDACLLRGESIASVLVRCADALPAALIAMNSHARHGIARFALGSETMALAHRAHCPLLVTHPHAIASER